VLFRQVDLILLHAPSIYDFRKTPHLLGPISDVVPSTPIFEMYPVGFSAIVDHLLRHKLSVRIVNLAYRMLENPDFDVEKFIAKLNPVAFGIDLHWLPHAHGSIEIAKICKKLHPKIPVMFGGYSATYFHQELIQYPAVDFVLRGDTTEDSIRLLLEQLKSESPQFHAIPGLTWQNVAGETVINDPVRPSGELLQNSNNYLNLFRMAIKFLDIKSLIAIRDWWEYPITAIMTCRGCTQNCIICGGSQKSVKDYVYREKIGFRNPEKVAADVAQVSRFTRAPIFIIGDLHQGGYDYAAAVFEKLRERKIKNEIVLELFIPARESFFDDLSRSVKNFNFEMSPESHDPVVRRKSGKYYSNAAMENNIRWALDRGCKKFDIFFMIGLSHQTYESVLETVDYCAYLIETFGPRCVPFISPLAPFLDPGSLAYENADAYGYRIRFKTLEEYRQALLQPSWKHVLSYETEWLDREAIVQATYEAGRRLTRIKAKFGLVTPEQEAHTLANIDRALEKHQKIERLDLSQIDLKDQRKYLENLGFDMERDSISTICYKHEIRWPKARKAFKFISIAKAILFE
jgi:B12-binding domain/radical SAM domain protein